MYDNPVPIPGGFFSGQVFFPRDGVLAKTIFLEMERGNPQSRRRLETQVLHFDGLNWQGYTYQWNDEQTDAALVPAAGADRTFTVVDAKAPGGKRKQTWHFPSRAQCMTCHNPWAGHALAFTLAQLNREHDYNGVRQSQLRALREAGLIAFLRHQDSGDKTLTYDPRIRLTNPYDPRANLNERARSYLQVNCSHCHQFGAGGTADLELRYGPPLEQTKTLEVRPTQGTFAIPGAHILSPGDPFRSVLFYRMAKLGNGRMPHIGSEIVDEPGLRLIHDWIRQLPIRKDERALVAKLCALDEAVFQRREKGERNWRLKQTAQEIARKQGRDNPNAEDQKAAEVQLKAEAEARTRAREAERADLLKQLLATTPSATMLAYEVQEGKVAASVRAGVLRAALASSDPQVRDLFERFVPDEQRVKRLGSVIKAQQILELKGDAARGKELFFKSAALQCINCHRIAGTGSTLGPDLTEIGKKSTRAQILESILEPSRSIDPKYVTYLVETTDGKVLTGLLVEKTAKAVVLRTVRDEKLSIPAGKVSVFAPQRTSLMPELLLRDLTAEQAADLLEYLASLK
jgi:putative heme-binding domain-containing protein